MEWKSAVVGEDARIDIPDNWLYLHYYDALSVLFRIENALRVFVFLILKSNYNERWAELSLQSDEHSDTTIGALARRRQDQDRTFGYLTYSIGCPLMYLTSGELIRLIISESYWPLFKPFFDASKEVVALKLNEIGNVRNALAHFRPIRADDVEVVKQNAKQVLSKIEAFLAGAFRCKQVVPTNAIDDWYKALVTVGSEEVALSFAQSDDGEWIRVKITFVSGSFHRTPVQPQNRVSYSVAKLVAPRILDAYEQIRDHVAFVTEVVPYLRMPADFELPFEKQVWLTFRRETLANEYLSLKSDLEGFIRKVGDESRLLAEDNLAKGDFLQVVRITAIRPADSRIWRVDTSPLLDSVGPDTPAEYWSTSPGGHQDTISDTESFPWMPVNISSAWFPF